MKVDLYHNWLYQKVFNTAWFMWIIVYVTIGINVLAPIIVWVLLNIKRLTKRPEDNSNKQT